MTVVKEGAEPAASEEMAEFFDLVIIGAGPTALGALQRFHELKERRNIRANVRVLVVEREAEPGGLARTVTDENGFSWDLGVHVTGPTRFKAFADMCDSVIDKWNVFNRCVKADISHLFKRSSGSARVYAPYPVQNSIHHFPEDLRLRSLSELEELEKKASTSNGQDFAEFSRRHFGQTLQEVFIRPYNEKFWVWTVALEEMSSEWVEGRVPKIDLPKLRRRCRSGGDEDEDLCYFKYPANCTGIGGIWIELARRFDQNCFRFNTDVADICTKKKTMTTRDLKSGKEKEIRFELLISTIPILELNRISRFKPECNLKYSKVLLVGVALQKPQNELASSLSWAYYPQDDIIFYRCTVISNFSSMMTPNPNKYWSVMCEIGRKPDDIVDQEATVRKVLLDLVEVGLIDSLELIESTWFNVISYGYPIPTLNRSRELAECSEILAHSQIYSRGRFGSWAYETSNQDNCFEIGRRVVDRLYLDVDE